MTTDEEAQSISVRRAHGHVLIVITRANDFQLIAQLPNHVAMGVAQGLIDAVMRNEAESGAKGEAGNVLYQMNMN